MDGRDLDSARLRDQALSIEPHHSPSSPPPTPPPPAHQNHDSDDDSRSHHHHQPQSTAIDRLPYDFEPPSSDPDAHQELTAKSPPSSDHTSAYHPGAAARAHRHAFGPVRPDAFYETSQVSPSDSTPNSLPMAPSSDPRPDLSSSAAATAPGNPGVPPNRSLPRPSNLRSASNPVGASLNSAVSGPRHSPSGKPSVKDLRKRFDQNGNASSIPSPGGAPRSRNSGADTAQPLGTGASPYSALRSADSESQLASGLPHTARSQRPKYMVQDQISNNPQSFASRVAKPRRSNDSEPNKSPSLALPSTSLSPSTSASSTQTSQGLLFGEILPDQYDTSALGFGIDSVLPRSGSDTAAPLPRYHQRSLSDPESEPSSPGNWYRNADARQTEYDPNSYVASTQHIHIRSLSDNLSKRNDEMPAARNGSIRGPLPPAYDNTPAPSKLPLSIRRLHSPANSSSSDSTRPNSPSSMKRQRSGGRLSRATTPTSRTSKNPIQDPGGRRLVPGPLPSSGSGTRLEPYVGAPPPKLSPPLRSSRPRQPVSVASTASSSKKAVDRTRVPIAVQPVDASKPTAPTTRRRKISVGPIDFEQRREHIRLAYSKSLRESQALEARKRAAERRRQEQEAAAKEEQARREARGEVVPELTPEIPGDGFPPVTESGHPEHQDTVTPETSGRIDPLHDTTPDALAAQSTLESSASAASSKETLSQAQPALVVVTTSVGSPDLGLPGSFPASTPPLTTDEAPPSAVSATTETTEFDLDPDRQSLLPPGTPEEAPITIVKPPSPQATNKTPARARAQYHYPFEEEQNSPEKPAVSRASVPVEPLSAKRGEHATAQDSFTNGYQMGDDSTLTARQEQASALSLSREDTQSEDGPTGSIPFPRLEMQDGSDCCSDVDGARGSMYDTAGGQEDATTDACTEDTEDQRGMDDLSLCRDSSCVSSDAGDEANATDASYNEPADVGNRLAPPTRPDRFSQHSQWTDFTVESPNPSDAAKSSDMDDYEDSPTYGHVTIFGSRVVSQESDAERASVPPSRNSTRLPEHPRRLELPDIGTDDGFTIPYLSSTQAQSSPYLPSPNHEPPPIPASTSGSVLEGRTSGPFYEKPHFDNSLMNSTPGSEGYASRIDTPRTADTNSVSAPDTYSGTPYQSENDAWPRHQSAEDLPDKERHRLIQRRNVIRELLDTEAVFVRDMNIVEEIYKGTAEACPKLDTKTVKQIFRNTDDIIAFHTAFLAQVREAVSSVYVPKGGRSPQPGEVAPDTSKGSEISDAKDREVLLGPVFSENIEQMKMAHEGFLRSSDQAAKRLIQIQQDPTVKVWLNECNEVAKELTAAWDLDSLLIKPMQRITKYPNLIITILQHTPSDHPDREALASAKDSLETAIVEINQTKKNFELVGQIVGRKRKESDVRNGLARAFGKRVDKLQVAGSRPSEDPEYAKLNEKFGDDYLRLQVVLRDVEFYTRQVTSYVREFLQYLSSVELVMRLQPGNYPEIESKWVQFNISIRDIEKSALEDHVSVYPSLVALDVAQCSSRYHDSNPMNSWPKLGS